MNPVAVQPSRLLAIEDDPVLGTYLHEQLVRCGFEVGWCQNGQEGLSRARDLFLCPLFQIEDIEKEVNGHETRIQLLEHERKDK